MTGSCPKLDSAAPVMTSLAQYLDCQADKISQAGFPATGHGVVSQELLTVCMTIFVALFGYRLLFDRGGLSGRTLLYSAARLGIIVALSTSWPAYSVLIVNVVNKGPVELASAIARPLSLSIAEPAFIAAQLQVDFDQVETRTPRPDPSPLADTAESNVPVQTAAGQLSSPVTTPQVTLMAATLGGLVCLKLGGAILLAIGPLVIGLSLFDIFLPLAGAWAKALLGLIFAGVAARIVVALQMVFLKEVVVARAISTSIPQLDPALAPTAAVFLVLNILAVGLAFFAVGRLQWPRRATRSIPQSKPGIDPTANQDRAPLSEDVPVPRSRTLLTADYVRRESLAEVGGRPPSPWTQGLGRSPLGTGQTAGSRDQGAPARRQARISRTPIATERDARL